MDDPTRGETILTRRRYLLGSVAVVVATAGCSSGDPTEAPVAEPTPSATERPTQSPIETRNPTVRPAEESCATTEAELPASDGAVRSSPAVVDGTVVVGSDDGRDGLSGEEAGSVPTGAAVGRLRSPNSVSISPNRTSSA